MKNFEAIVGYKAINRFDHILEFECPEGQDAEDIVAFYLSKKAYVADMDVKRIARLLEGKSCAQLETVVNQAGAYAAYDGRGQIEMKDVIKAQDSTLRGLSKRKWLSEVCGV